MALFGANGSGKTTFVLHLNGLLRGEGSIEICGLPLADETLEQIRSKVGVVFQDSDEQLFMPTVLEDVAFGPLNLGLSPDDALTRARTVLKRVGMAHALERAPYHLSAGEKKRVAIAGVLAMDPEILVLDEPTTFLDPPARRDLLTLLREPAAGQSRGDARCQSGASSHHPRSLLRSRPHRRRGRRDRNHPAFPLGIFVTCEPDSRRSASPAHRSAASPPCAPETLPSRRALPAAAPLRRNVRTTAWPDRPALRHRNWAAGPCGNRRRA